MKRTYTKVGEVQSHSSGRVYDISEDQYGNLSCECMSWRFQNKPPEERVCKHTEEFLAQERASNKDEVILI